MYQTSNQYVFLLFNHPFYKLVSLFQATTQVNLNAMPRATAKLGDTTIAETDTWENVEGNVYVRLSPVHLQHSNSNDVVPFIFDQGPVGLAKVRYLDLLPLERDCIVL